VTRRLLALLSAFALTACGRSDSPSDQPPPVADPSPNPTPAPDSFRVAFETGKGRFVVQAHRSWAPLGVDRFHELVKANYYDRVKFFRVLPDFMAQFGMHGDPAVQAKWGERNILDDPVKESNRKGAVTFAMGGPNTRSTQLFINSVDNPRLDGMGFAPIGRVTEGIEVVEKLYNGYGEGAPQGYGPEQGLITRDGNRYLDRYFPRLDSIISARIIP
jgi:peptidyl-prolyl cis-trans isomerase A (cyclophilin A)